MQTLRSRGLGLIATVLLLPVVAGHGSLPLNPLGNPSFELDSLDWSCEPGSCGAMHASSPGTQASATSWQIPNRVSGPQYLYQWFQPSPPHQFGLAVDALMMLDFDAQIVSGLSNPGFQTVQVQSGYWVPGTGLGQVIVQVMFHSGMVRVNLYATNTNMNYYTMVGPSDGQWHHYRVVFDPATRAGSFLIDNALQFTLVGGTGTIGAPNVMVLGDAMDADWVQGPAPEMRFDEIYFGPW